MREVEDRRKEESKGEWKERRNGRREGGKVEDEKEKAREREENRGR